MRIDYLGWHKQSYTSWCNYFHYIGSYRTTCISKLMCEEQMRYSRLSQFPELRIKENRGLVSVHYQIDMFNALGEKLICWNIFKHLNNTKMAIRTFTYYSSSTTITMQKLILDGYQLNFLRDSNLRGFMDYLTINSPLPIRITVL